MLESDVIIEKYRKEFPITEKYIFLDHAAVAPMSLRAREAIETFLDENYSLGAKRFEIWNERTEGVRAAAAGLIGAKPSEIAFIPNTSTGLNHVAQGLSWSGRENVVTFDGEFPANVYPWMNVAKKGVSVRLVPQNKYRVRYDDVLKNMDGHTKLLSASSVEFITGYRNDLEKLGRLCLDEGVLFCVDGIQSLGAFPMNVKENNIDFLAADGHKWLLAPEGIGIFYVSEKHMERLRVPYAGWKSVENPLEFVPYHFTIRKDAAKFEPGSFNLAGLFALGASIRLLTEFGVENAAKRIIALTDRLADGLTKRGWEVISPRENDGEKSGIVSFKGKTGSEKVVAKMASKKVMVGRRGEFTRVSPHFYNTFGEIGAFLKILGENPK